LDHEQNARYKRYRYKILYYSIQKMIFSLEILKVEGMIKKELVQHH